MGDKVFFKEAIELKPGCIYAIECDCYLTIAQNKKVQDWSQIVTKRTGVKFIIINCPLKLVTRPSNKLSAIAARLTRIWMSFNPRHSRNK